MLSTIGEAIGEKFSVFVDFGIVGDLVRSLDHLWAVLGASWSPLPPAPASEEIKGANLRPLNFNLTQLKYVHFRSGILHKSSQMRGCVQGPAASKATQVRHQHVQRGGISRTSLPWSPLPPCAGHLPDPELPAPLNSTSTFRVSLFYR